MVLWRLFHHSKIQRYHTLGPKGEEPWALVTGASDGIGKGVARELLAQGFNVILHGRNIEKLERVKTELLAQAPGRSVSFWTWDATQSVGTGGVDLSASLAESIPSDTRLVALVNNVGYTSTYQAFAEQDSGDIDKILHIQAFTMYLTRILLPKMYSDNKPALVINVAGLTRSYPAPLLAVHSGEKAAIVNWSRALALEFELAKQPAGADVEVLCVDIHVVASNSNSSEKSFFAPDGTEMGVAIIGCVGCGKRVVTAYWPHEVTAGILKWLPMSFMDSTMAKQLVAMKERESKLVEERARNGQST